MHYERKKWNELIDPHFNEVVAKYVQFLDQTGIPSSSGWIIFEDEPMKQWEQKGMQGWIRVILAH